MTDFTKETHIGDGVYASYDGYQIKLRVGRPTTIALNSRQLGNAIVDHEVYLDDHTFAGLLEYRRNLIAHLAAMGKSHLPDPA